MVYQCGLSVISKTNEAAERGYRDEPDHAMGLPGWRGFAGHPGRQTCHPGGGLDSADPGHFDPRF